MRHSNGTILNETYHYLQQRSYLSGCRVNAISLGNYFTVIELNDGRVGAGMSYYNLPKSALKNVQTWVEKKISQEPLLEELLFSGSIQKLNFAIPENQKYLLICALQTSLISALSANILPDGDKTFYSSTSCSFNPFKEATSALVIGFGGYMEYLAKAEHIKELHVADLSCFSRRTKVDSKIEYYRDLYPLKKIEISNGSAAMKKLPEFDVVTITGSALCNGTLDNLLYKANGCPMIIVQGQSAGIHPKILFERGVHLVVTTIKPRELIYKAILDINGIYIRSMLEGGLPSVYLTPRYQNTG